VKSLLPPAACWAAPPLAPVPTMPLEQAQPVL
jgi:hypothetical protein